MPAKGESPALRLGVSACLLGEAVRYDGGHKRDAFLTETLGPLVQWAPVCPEVEIGLGVPREAIRLVGDPGAPRLRTERTGADLTARMARFAAARTAAMEALGLDGYVLKHGSPSCGLFRVPVHGEDGRRGRAGRGLFAAALVTRLPLLPVEEEGRLADPAARGLAPGERAELSAAIADYRRGRVPLAVPLTLVRHHAGRRGLTDLADQAYLNPHPRLDVGGSEPPLSSTPANGSPAR